MKAVYLWVLFCFSSHALQKENYVEITLAKVQTEHRNILPIYHFSRRFIDYKRDIKPLLTVRGRLLARLFKLVLMKPIKTSPIPHALLNVGG